MLLVGGNTALRGMQDREADSAFSEQELARLAAIKQAKSSGENEGMIQGALSEIGLIDWPQPAKAAVETVYVLGIVIGASAFLFGLNTVLTEVSKQLY
jgi:preprotein translocase subunit SecE